MRCIKCNKEIGGSYKYCAFCGAEQKIDNQQIIMKQANTRTIYRVALIGGILLTILAIGVWIYAGIITPGNTYQNNETNGFAEKSEEKDHSKSINKKNESELNTFVNKTNGIWANLEDAQRLETGETVFDFAVFDDGTLNYGTYPGDGGREGRITDINHEGDEYVLTVHYDAEEYMGDMYEEEDKNVILVFTEDSFYDKEYPEYIYTYAGENLDETIAFVSDFAKKNIDSRFDVISLNAPFLGNSIADVLMKNRGLIDGPNGPYGSSDVFKNNAIGFYHLSNYENMDVYSNYPGLMNQYLGVVDGTVVFFGETVDYTTIRQLVPDSVTEKDPIIYECVNSQNYNATDYMAVWKINNGYMIINTHGSYYERSFYDEMVSTVSYVSDLKYLSYIR